MAIGKVISYGCITYSVFALVGDFVVCIGPSMEPTLHNNNIVFHEHISPRFGLLEKGDIVIAKSPWDPRENICKRIVALPGNVMYHDNASTFIPKGHVWLEGDNSGNSLDSRNYGPIPQGLIRGRVVCTVWPINFSRLSESMRRFICSFFRASDDSVNNNNSS